MPDSGAGEERGVRGWRRTMNRPPTLGARLKATGNGLTESVQLIIDYLINQGHNWYDYIFCNWNGEVLSTFITDHFTATFGPHAT